MIFFKFVDHWTLQISVSSLSPGPKLMMTNSVLLGCGAIQSCRVKFIYLPREIKVFAVCILHQLQHE